MLYLPSSCLIGIYRLRAPKNLTPKLRALPSRFFLLRICPLFSRGSFFVRPQNALSFFFLSVSPLFSRGRFFPFFFRNCDLSNSCYVLSMFFSVQSHVQSLLIVYSCLLFSLHLSTGTETEGVTLYAMPS